MQKNKFSFILFPNKKNQLFFLIIFLSYIVFSIGIINRPANRPVNSTANRPVNRPAYRILQVTVLFDTKYL